MNQYSSYMGVTTEAEVVVVGGGLVGLASAAFLARHGVRTALVGAILGSGDTGRLVDRALAITMPDDEER